MKYIEQNQGNFEDVLHDLNMDGAGSIVLKEEGE
jgi:hypothetical protein